MNDEEKRDIMARSHAIMNQMGKIVATIKEIPIASKTPETDAQHDQWRWESTEGKLYGEWVAVDFARKLEQERDKYAGLLCEAMSYTYGWPNQGPNVSALISAFEALELTPANGSC